MTTRYSQFDTLPSTLLESGKRFFGEPYLYEGLKLIRNSRVSISFSKGSSESFYIVSGIVKDDRQHEAKIVYKKRLEESQDGPLASNCDCLIWSQHGHCPHTASLYINYQLSLAGQLSNEADGAPSPSVAIDLLGASVPSEYGTVIGGPHKLEGASPQSTYSSLLYRLHTGKIVHFPLPSSWSGKLQISYKRVDLNDGHESSLSEVKFHYLNSENQIEEKISIFEYIYLFNWNNGECFHLPQTIKDFVRRFKNDLSYIEINEIIQYINQHNLWDLISISIDNEPFSQIKRVNCFCQINITQSTKKNHLNLSLVFHDEEKKVAVIPSFFKLFTFGSGDLSSFKKKKEASDFISSVCESFKNDNELYKKTLVFSSRKNQILDEITDALRNEYQLIYDEKYHLVYQYPYHFLRIMLIAIFDSFGEISFRYGSYGNESRELTFHIPTGTLFSGIAEFHQRTSPYGVQIFYNRNELQTWKSKIRFERRESNLQWFDLELQMTMEDYQLIHNADIDSRVALINNGLILLSKEQQDILKFVKRYTGKNATGETRQGDQFKFMLPINRARIFELFELKRLGIDGALTPNEEELCKKLLTLEKIPTYDIPEHLTTILRPYQKTCYHWLRFLHEHKMGACLADDMGLGKTLQTIAFVNSIYHQIKKVIVICPVTILINWEKEIEKFSKMDHYIFHGDNRSPPPDTKIIITSYGMMKKEASNYFKNQHFDIMILDEVQHLKNIRSLGAFAARQLNADFRICLTGTPVENDLAEFYNILDLAVPGIWGDLQFIKTISNQKSRSIAKKTASPFILRRTKSQVLKELPEKVENNVLLPFSDDERSYYLRSLAEVRQRINNAVSKQKYGEILKGLLELRQLCLWQQQEKLYSTKINFLMEMLEQILEENHKVIVFSQFTRYLDIIQKIVHEKHWKFSRIDGAQPMKRRQLEIDKFQEGDSQVFLISLKAGGVGLNLTAASYVFIMDPWWNPAVENQAIDRAHRIGQKNRLTVYRPLIQNSVEEKVLKLQDMKRQLFKELLPDDDESIFTGKLSAKDFEMLLS